MTAWSQITSGANETWSAGDSGATKAWTDLTFSNTTLRNLSRFIPLNPSTRSTRGGVDFAVHFRSFKASGLGVGFIWDSDNPIIFHRSGDSTI